MKLPVVDKNTTLNAIKGNYNSCKIRGYTGAEPATGDTAESGTLLFECIANATAFPSASSAVLTANAITSDASADNTGTCGHIATIDADGTTKRGYHSVSTVGGGGEFQLSTLSVVAGQGVDINSWTVSGPADI